jgi:hypothetical protein
LKYSIFSSFNKAIRCWCGLLNQVAPISIVVWLYRLPFLSVHQCGYWLQYKNVNFFARGRIIKPDRPAPMIWFCIIHALFVWNLLFFISLMIGFPPTTNNFASWCFFQNGSFTVPLTFSSCSLDNSRETHICRSSPK